MRFVVDGPDIPNELVKKWRDGEVLFLAGAGVSASSGLPLFDGLGLRVYETIKDSLSAVLQVARTESDPAKQSKILDGAGLPPQRRNEANLFLDKQYDRFFSALEKRIDAELRGRPKTRRIRSAVEEILAASAYSACHQDLLRLSRVISHVDPSRPPSCRIVTTNFDLLFESAWKVEFRDELRSHDARMAPRPGVHDFHGIIHLHGMLSEDGRTPANFILSSRDFARSYLRSGVIGNYVYDLTRRYTVVLVGYSADDPPMKYLMDAIGEDASIFADMKTVFAITDLQFAITDPRAAVKRAEWESKEIAPIFFSRRPSGDPFAPLWQTIHEWSDWARLDADWVKQKLSSITSQRRADVSPFEQAFVQDLVSVLTFVEQRELVDHLNKLRVDFAWIDAFKAADAAGVDVVRDGGTS